MIATAAPEMIAGTSIAAMQTQVQAHVQACSHGERLAKQQHAKPSSGGEFTAN